MNKDIRKEIRLVFKYLQSIESGHDKYGNNGYVTLSGKKYFVGKMSYDEWYIEPYRKDRKETEKFSDKTIWEKSDTLSALQLFSDNNLIDVIANFIVL